MSKKALIKCLQEIIGLFDLTVIAVGNILWCQNELRTQDNSSILLILLTIGKGNDWNIIKYHGETSKFSMVDMKVTTTLKPHGWPADITVRKSSI